MPRKKREPSFEELLEFIPKIAKRQRQKVVIRIIRENGYVNCLTVENKCFIK